MAPADTGLFPEELVLNIFLKTRLLQLGAPAAGEAELLPTTAFRCLRGNLARLASPCLAALPCLALPNLALLCLALPCFALPCLALSNLSWPRLALSREGPHPAPHAGSQPGSFSLEATGASLLKAKVIPHFFLDNLQNISLLQ